MVRILLIDDNPDDRSLVMRELNRAFAELMVEQIIDTEDLNQALSAGNFDLVITDYQLGWSDGITVLRSIKARYPDCPMVMFTNSGNEEISVEAMKAGVDDYVLKSPKHYLRLVMAVRSSWEQARQRQALKEAENRYSNLFNGVPVGLYCIKPTGHFLDVNAALMQLLGYSAHRALLDMKTIDFHINAEAWQQWRDLMERKDVVRDLETSVRTLDGRTIWVRHSAIAVRDGAGKVLYYEGAIEDVTERKRMVEQLEASLQEKEVLLKEIHHRVKNNMQVICSLLNLQSRSISDPNTLTLLQECQNRIFSMALVHEQLYQSEDLASINFAEYIENLVNNLFSSYDVASSLVSVKVNVDNVSLSVDTAIPCGLIINELVSNSLKYAFPSGRAGEICIELHLDREKYFNLRVSDNGIGLPQNLEYQNTKSLGLQLVTALTSQLSGTIALNRNMGTEFNIKFQDKRIFK